MVVVVVVVVVNIYGCSRRIRGAIHREALIAWMRLGWNTGTPKHVCTTNYVADSRLVVLRLACISGGFCAVSAKGEKYRSS